MAIRDIRGPMTVDNTTVVTSGASYSMGDESILIINKGAGSATTVNLPPAPRHGQVVTIKDGKGDAATNNITIQDPNSKTIDGTATLLLNINAGTVQLVWDAVSSTPQWRLADYTAANPAGFQLESAANGLTAHAGGGQGSATPITTMIARFSTVASLNDSAILPAGKPGMVVTVINNGAQSMNVFPATGETINALAANTALAVTTTTPLIFYCVAAGAWYTK